MTLTADTLPDSCFHASGKLADTWIYKYYNAFHNQIICDYYTPFNPRSPRQQSNRGRFACAVLSWQGLSSADRDAWKVQASRLHMSGYNLFIRAAMAFGGDSGNEFPPAPVTGQWFYRTDIKCLFLYDTAWNPIISFGAFTLYVDSTLGSDVAGKGYGLETYACASISYAWSLIPPIYGGNVSVYVAPGTYADTSALRGKTSAGQYNITFYGEFESVVAGLFPTSATIGNSTTAYGTITKTSAGWSINAYEGNYIQFAQDCPTVALRGQIYTIWKNTSDTITIVGAFAGSPTVVDEFGIVVPGCHMTNSFVLGAGQQYVYFYRFSFDYSTGIRAAMNSLGFLYYCHAAAASQASFQVQNSILYLYNCYGKSTTRTVWGNTRCYIVFGLCVFSSSWASGAAIDIRVHSSIYGNSQSNVIIGNLYGIKLNSSSVFLMSVADRITIADATTGIFADHGSQSDSYVSPQFSGCGTNIDADAATFASIG
jgi:hypothetical protein